MICGRPISSESPRSAAWLGDLLSGSSQQATVQPLDNLARGRECCRLYAHSGYRRVGALGYVLRSRLIEKWITLGATSNYDRESLAHKVTEVERVIDTVLGKNLLPAYPIFIPCMSQQLEAGTPLSTKSGAYGYLYEVLITTALNTTSRSVGEIDTKYTCLTEFAWYLRGQTARECDREEMHQFNERHRTTYRLAQPVDLWTSPADREPPPKK
jgi:hypothetical protein